MSIFNFAEHPTPPTFLQSKVIAENSTSGVKVYHFTWKLPTNNESADIKYIKFQVDEEPLITFVSTSTEITLPLSYPGEHNISIIAVDRCDRESKASILSVNIQRGERKLHD